MYKNSLLTTVFSLYSLSCLAATYQVTNNDGGASSGSGLEGNFSYCLSSASSGDMIDCSPIANQTISLTSTLPQITQNISISGAGVTINGNDTYQGIVLPESNTIAITNLTISHARSKGGDGGSSSFPSGLGGFAGGGGGGGAGAGAALFIGSNSSITLDQLSFSQNRAIGGNGGSGDGNGGTASGNFGGGGGGGGSYAGTVGITGGGIGGGGGGGNSNISAPSGANGTGSVGGTGGAGGNGTSGSPGQNGTGQGGGGGGGGTNTSGDSGGNGGNGALFAGGGGGGFGFLRNGGTGGSGGYLGGGGGGGTGTSNGGGIGGLGGFGGGGGGGGDCLNSDTPSGGSSSFGGGNGGSGSANPTIDPTYGGGGGGGGAGLGGAIFIQNNGTLIVENAITFSGNTVQGGSGGIAGGHAENGSAGSQLGEDIFLCSGGTIILNLTSPLIISTNIESNQNSLSYPGGGITKRGASTLSLLGTNTYTGQTSVEEGTLIISDQDSIGGNNANLTLGGAHSATLSLLGSTFQSSGNLNINNDSLIAFNAANSTFTFSGTVIGSNNSTLSSSGDGVLIFETIQVPSGEFTISAPIGSSETISFSGDGMAILSGDNSHTGTVLISGNLAVNGSIASNVIIQNGGRLQGSGTINNSIQVESDATLSPGNSSGTLNIQGPVTFADGSTFNIDLDTNGISKIVVSDTVSIGSNTTLSLRALDGFSSINATDSYIIESSGLSGTFSHIVKNIPLLRVSLVYSENNLLLQFNQVLFDSLGLEGNPLAVGTAIDEITLSGNSALDSVVDTLAPLTTNQISSALNQMQPALFKGLTISQENNTIKVRESLSYRMQNELDRMHCANLTPNKQDSIATSSCSKKRNALHLWIDGFGDILHQKSNRSAASHQTGYQNKTGGVVLGLDGNFAKYFYAGALGSYTSSDIDWSNNQGNGHIETGYGGVYFSALSKLYYANVSVMGNWSHFHTKRNVHYPGFDASAKENHGGSGLLSHLDTGINLGLKGFSIRPFDSFDYLTQTENSYTETGGGAINLHVNSSNSIFIRNELGVEFSSCFCLKSSNWTLSPKLSWVREVRVKGAHSTANFVNTDTTFGITGYFPDRSLIAPGVMVSGSYWKDLLTFNLYYNGEFGEKYSDHNYGGQIRFGF